MFENDVLKKILGPKREAVAGHWRKLRNAVLHDLYSTKFHSGDQIKEHDVGWACGTWGREEKGIQGFDGKNWTKDVCVKA